MFFKHFKMNTLSIIFQKTLFQCQKYLKTFHYILFIFTIYFLLRNKLEIFWLFYFLLVDVRCCLFYSSTQMIYCSYLTVWSTFQFPNITGVQFLKILKYQALKNLYPSNSCKNSNNVLDGKILVGLTN